MRPYIFSIGFDNSFSCSIVLCFIKRSSSLLPSSHNTIKPFAIIYWICRDLSAWHTQIILTISQLCTIAPKLISRRQHSSCPIILAHMRALFPLCIVILTRKSQIISTNYVNVIWHDTNDTDLSSEGIHKTHMYPREEAYIIATINSCPCVY